MVNTPKGLATSLLELHNLRTALAKDLNDDMLEVVVQPSPLNGVRVIARSKHHFSAIAIDATELEHFFKLPDSEDIKKSNERYYNVLVRGIEKKRARASYGLY